MPYWMVKGILYIMQHNIKKDMYHKNNGLLLCEKEK